MVAFQYFWLESAKLVGLRGLVGRVGAWVAWVENLRGSRGLCVSKNRVGGVGRSFCVGGVGPWNGFIVKTLSKISQNLQENICAGVSSCRLKTWKFIKKEISGQVFPCEFCEVFKNSYFVERLHTFVAMFFYYIFRGNNLKGFQ